MGGGGGALIRCDLHYPPLAISCGSPPLVTNGQVVIDTRDSLVGARVLYRCDPGYSLEVQDSDVVVVSQGFLTSVCLIGGQWSVVPTCVGELLGLGRARARASC